MAMAATNDGTALQAAIRACPDDDAPRLVYADWLQENGDESRAEFIRAQIAVARGESARTVLYRFRVAKLLTAHGREWFPECSGWGVTPHPNKFREFSQHQLYHAALVSRGFLSHIRCRMRDWERLGPTLVMSQPLEHVTIGDREVAEEWSEDEDGNDEFQGLRWDMGSDGAWDQIPPHIHKYLLWEYYTDDDSARSDLSQACLAWARAESQAPSV